MSVETEQSQSSEHRHEIPAQMHEALGAMATGIDPAAVENAGLIAADGAEGAVFISKLPEAEIEEIDPQA